MKELHNVSELQLLNAHQFTFIYPLRVQVTAVQKQDRTLQATFVLLVGEYAIGECTQEYDTIERLLDTFDIADHEEIFEVVADVSPFFMQHQARRNGESMTSNDTRQQSGQESLAIPQEFDLGDHTLFLMSDGGIDLIVNDEQTPALVQLGLRLNSDETYRLFISLHEQFKQQQARMEEERATRERGREGNLCNW